MRGIAAFTVRTYATRQDYEPRLSAQILRSQPTNQQFTALRPNRFRSSDKSQVEGEKRRDGDSEGGAAGALVPAGQWPGDRLPP